MDTNTNPKNTAAARMRASCGGCYRQIVLVTDFCPESAPEWHANDLRLDADESDWAVCATNDTHTVYHFPAAGTVDVLR